MGIIGIILYWITSLFIGKNNLPLKSEIKATNIKLISSFKYFSINSMIRSNLDIKPVILILFFISFLLNIFLIAVVILLNVFYISYFVYLFFGCEISGVPIVNLNWIYVLIFNIIILMLATRIISDSLKLSLRGIYRNNYLKILILDICTLNILSIIGVLIFFNNRKAPIQNNDCYTFIGEAFNSQANKNYFLLIFKIESLILILELLIFVLTLILGYFIKINLIKFICLAINLIVMTLIYGWSLIRIIGSIILLKMYKKLVQNNNFNFLLSIIRFLAFDFGYYHVAVLVNLLRLNEKSKTFILDNW